MIYTKTGDRGETSLANGQRVTKTDTRIEAYGTVDELNSWIGALRCALPDGGWRTETDARLAVVQNRLFNLGAALSEAPGEWIAESDVQRIEGWIDAMQAEVPKQHAFLLPAGTEAVCRCHICRTVCRRAERCMIAAKADDPELRFINRLSDYLYVLARYIACKNGEKEAEWSKN